MVDLHYPPSTVVGKPVPKNAFYKHLEVNARVKQHFVDDVVRIDWLYKLAPSTLNIEDGKDVHEIVVFSALLKQRDCPDDVFLFIDKNMPRHVVFILEHDGQYRLLLNYKEWQDEKTGIFRIVKTFVSEWFDAERLTLPIEGHTLDAIYEAMAGSISGFGTTSRADAKRVVELQDLISKGLKQVEALQKKIRTEKQFNRQMEMNTEARTLKKQVAQWQKELSELKQ